MGDHRRRFERWRKKLPHHTAYLVDQVLARIVPEFEARGFVWYPDYGGGDSTQIGANTIPLQRRARGDWPTVELRFHKRFRPWFAVDFGALPPVCKRWTADGYVEIPRERAVVVDAPACFALCKGQKRSLDCEYGYRWFSLFPRRYLDAEIETVLGLLPELFATFDRGVPQDWLMARRAQKVAKHVMLLNVQQRA